MNRVSASRLYRLSQALEAPIAYFYQDLGLIRIVAYPRPITQFTTGSLEADPLSAPETLDLLEAYLSVRDPKVRKQLLRVAKEFSLIARTRAAELPKCGVRERTNAEPR